MSNDLITGSTLPLLPGGKAVEIINAPLRFIAPAMKALALCQPEMDALWEEFCGVMLNSSAVDRAKRTREMLLPRAVEVRQACDLVRSIRNGESSIDAPNVLKMISVMHRVLIKKKDNAGVSLMAYASLFDEEIDSVGVSLNLWKEVPRHPAVIALAIQRMFHKQVYPPAPAELCDACHWVAERLKARGRSGMSWLGDLFDAEMKLFEQVRDEWETLYTTPETLEAASALDGIVRRNETDKAKELRRARETALHELRMLT